MTAWFRTPVIVRTSRALARIGARRMATMIIVQHDGALEWSDTNECAMGRAMDTVEVPADALAQQSDLLDRLFALAFDRLGLQTLELRVRPYAEGAEVCSHPLLPHCRS
jgi:hypothetical protein